MFACCNMSYDVTNILTRGECQALKKATGIYSTLTEEMNLQSCRRKLVIYVLQKESLTLSSCEFLEIKFN